MPAHTDYGPGSYCMVIFLLALLAFASPFTEWWGGINRPWYLPYLLWLLVIGFSWLLAKRMERHDI